MISRDVQNRFLYFDSVSLRFWKKLGFGSEWVCFSLKTLICDLCLKTLRHWSVSLWRDPDDVSHCWILSPDKTEWRLISATLCRWRRCLVADQSWFMKRIREVFGSVLKRQCLKRSWVQVKLYFVTFNSNCRLHTVAVGKPSERMSNFWTVGFSKSNPNRFSVFHTSLQISCVIVVFVIFGCFWFICKLSTFVANSFSCRLKFMYVVCDSY